MEKWCVMGRWKAGSIIAVALVAAVVSSTAFGKRMAAKGSCFSETADPDQRIAACTALIRAGTSAARTQDLALLGRAGAFGQKGDYDRAIEDTTRVIKRDPSPVAYYTRALAYHNLGDDERALADSNAALKIEPDNANALFVRAASYQGLAEYDKAIHDYTEVLRLDPSRVDARFSRGAARYDAGQYGRAVEDFSRAIDFGAAEGTVFYLRALAYRELGQDAKARADMEEALRRDPGLQENPLVPHSRTTTGKS
jgi:tetratricopeptide (TPR) repeat protein